MRAYVHIEELLGRGVPVYHTGVEFRAGPFRRRFDYGKQWGGRAKGRGRCVYIGETRRSPMEIAQYEMELSRRTYFLLRNDCRHHSEELLRYALDDDTAPPRLTNQLELWRLFNGD
jgi:hypothetical protein